MIRVVAALCLPALVAGVTSWEAASPRVPAPAALPRILIVNDDGVQSAGIAALVDALSPYAEVHVCAPDGNRSGASASTSALGSPMVIEARMIPGATSAWAVGGQPVDAVQYGLFELGPTGSPSDFDLVVSGINHGANVGDVQLYSGTVGAASAAVHYGVPAVAVSQEASLPNFLFAAGVTERFLRTLLQEGATPGVVYSINVPVGHSAAAAGMTAAPQGGDYFRIVDYQVTTDAQGVTTARAQVQGNTVQPAGSDTELYQQKHITITPLRIDRTDAGVLADMQSWTY